MRYTISDKEELTMSRQTKQHSQQFKQDAVKYVLEHPDLTNEECAKNLGIGLSTLSRWKKQYNDNEGTVPTRGSGNYSSDEAKEIARLKRKLRDAEDALDVLKKPSAFWEATDDSHIHRSRCQDGGRQSSGTPGLPHRNAGFPWRLAIWLPGLP